MDQMVNDGEMPIPNYAVGTRILLVDSDMTSLSQTTSILEETTYQGSNKNFFFLFTLLLFFIWELSVYIIHVNNILIYGTKLMFYLKCVMYEI